MAQQRSHVPKFGNWEGENVPYTACFENARKEKATGIRINPNDPQENPEAFNLAAPPKKHRFHKRNTSDQLKITSSTSGSDKTASHQQRGRSNRASYADDYSCGSVAVPKFGDWDDKNPRSAEGFTVIFDKVKEEKQIAAAKFPSVSVSVHQDVSKYHHTRRGKKCCGLF